MPDICYVDTETTGVMHFHEVWEVAVVKVAEDGAVDLFSCKVKPENFSQADPYALSIGRFSERWSASSTYENAAYDVWKLLEGCTLAGITVSFDARMLGDWFLRNNLPPFPWHYRLLDVSTYAAGIAAANGLIEPGDMPNSDRIFELYGIEIPEELRHTAFGDAKATQELHVAALKAAKEGRIR